MFVEILLATWSVIGLIWWVLSWRLVVAAESKSIPEVENQKTSLTIFKPLPPLEGRGLEIEARGLESFIKQLDATSELLLGVHEADWIKVEPFVQRMETLYPEARIVVVQRAEADTVANPKIAWQKLLVAQARGDWWFWSDADIVAPPGFLDRARAEFATCGAEMLTFPYAVRGLPNRHALLDALFVNTEFYPGVLLLRWWGPVDFGLGAGMLFSRASFQRKVDWEELGAALADDFVLGQALQPVRLSGITLETVADAADWLAAVAHYFRWKKTVCWCRPGGFAGQAVAMPLLGWLALVICQPWNLLAWFGLAMIVQFDVLFAVLICRKIGCRLDLKAIGAMEAWSLGRVVFWVLCWLPGRIRWREKSWSRFQQPSSPMNSYP